MVFRITGHSVEPVAGDELKNGHPCNVVALRNFDNNVEIGFDVEIPEEYNTLDGDEECDTVQNMFTPGEYLRVLCPDNCSEDGIVLDDFDVDSEEEDEYAKFVPVKEEVWE